MRSIVQKIFQDNNFSSLEIKNPFEGNNIEFWANYSEEAVNFYLVLFTDNIEECFLSHEVPAYFNEVKQIDRGYDERMDKNLSMIVCFNMDGNNTEKISEKIFDIEEDPYFFKKYVITYDGQNTEKLKLHFEGRIENSNTILNRIINDSNNFLEYKEDTSTSLYEICTKLMIKIPFIKLEKRLEEIEDLTGEITRVLKEKELVSFKNSLLNLDVKDDAIINDVLSIIKGDRR